MSLLPLAISVAAPPDDESSILWATRPRSGHEDLHPYRRRRHDRLVWRRPGAEAPPRVAAYGDIDELNSFIGVVRAHQPEAFFDELFATVQRDLFSIGGHLATPDPEKVRAALEKAQLSPDRVTEFETIMDQADQELPPLRAFVLPAGTPKAAALHVARTVCRRAERHLVALSDTVAVPELFVMYLNRLSDLLFTLARLANHREGRGDVTW